jgi:valyl-tRNA synthetase
MFEVLLRILHPFIPFITEEIWHLLKERPQGFSLMFEKAPSVKPIDKEKLSRFEQVKQVVGFVRNTRIEKQIPVKEKLVLLIRPTDYHNDFEAVVLKQANLSEIKIVTDKPESAVSYITADAEYYIPLGELHNSEEEIKKLEDELRYTLGFLESVMKKLNNEKFVNNAPAKVLELENRKKDDAKTKIKAIEERLELLKK